MSNRRTLNWSRYWAHEDERVRLDENGFLVDPTSPWGSIVNSKLRETSHLAGIPCLVMLGEPGTGKTKELDRLRSVDAQSGWRQLDVDLNTVSSDEGLEQRIFATEEFNALETGDSLLIYLDSFDECLLRLETVGNILGERLSQLDAQRLRLRIACRTAVWPRSLEAALRQVWDGEVNVLELQPLRQTDVKLAAADHGIDGDRFLAEVVQTRTGPLSARPITLRLLLGQFQSTRTLQASRWDLYERGCRALCDESDQSRRETRRIGGLTVNQRMQVASRAAAAALLSNHSEIWTGPASQIPPDHALPASELCGTETILAATLDVDDAAIAEVLDTGLFSARGPDRFGWSHRTFAEFLAARYLTTHQPSHEQIRSLLFNVDSGRSDVVPQVADVAAWLSSKNQLIRQSLLAAAPELLLKGDPAALSPETKRQLVDALLARVDSGEIHPRMLSGELDGLAYEQLVEPIRAAIGDSSLTIQARHLAIDIAEACRLSELSELLVEMVLDGDCDQRLRVNAAYALAEVADEPQRARLRPLVDVDQESDPDGELRGVALIALWPGQLSVADVTAALARPVSGDLIGALFAFTQYRFVQQMSDAQLLAALNWISGLPERRTLARYAAAAIDPLLVRGWRNADQPQLLAVLTAAIISRLRHDYDLGERSGESDLRELVRNDVETRRRVIAQAVTRASAVEQTAEIITLYGEPLVAIEDIPWIVSQALAASGELQRKWANLLRYAFRYQRPEYFDQVLEAAAGSSEIRSAVATFVDPIELDSDRARELREHHRRELETRARRSARTGSVRVGESLDDALDAIEAGRSELFSAIPSLLTRDPDGSGPGYRFPGPDVSKLPGWKVVNADRLGRICNAAVGYLQTQAAPDHAWAATREVPGVICAAYQAFALLHAHRSEKLDLLGADIWSRWALAIIRYPAINTTEEVETARGLARRLHEVAPRDFGLAVKRALVGDDAANNSIHCLNRLNGLAEAGPIVLEVARSLQLHEDSLGDALRFVLRHRADGAREFAEGLLGRVPGAVEDPVSVAAGTALLCEAEDCGWGSLYPLFQSHPHFGRAVLLKVCTVHIEARETIIRRLGEGELAQLFIWLYQQFPPSDDGDLGGGWLGPEDEIRIFRSTVLDALRNRGTQGAVDALITVQEAMPNEAWLRRVIGEARSRMLSQTWSPPTAREVLAICSGQKYRLVRSGDELLLVLEEALGRLQEELQGETPSAQDLWDLNPRRPKDENHLSDYVKRFLQRDLVDRGVIANREVEIRRGSGGRPGERTDIHVDAVTEPDLSGARKRATVIIETKGCWNSELFVAMRTQLVDRYVAESRCRHGIYLVGCFHCEQWDGLDARKGRNQHGNFRELMPALREQANLISTGEVRIRSIILNTGLR